MKRLITLAAVLSAGLAFGIGSAIRLDSTQPIGALTRIEAWQGQSLTLLPTVYQNGQLFTNAGTVRMLYGSNLLATAYGSASGIMSNGTATLTFGIIPITGRCVYAACVIEGAVTNVLGTGVFNITPATVAGAWPNLPAQTFPEADPVYVAWSLAGFPGVANAGALTNEASIRAAADGTNAATLAIIATNYASHGEVNTASNAAVAQAEAYAANTFELLGVAAAQVSGYSNAVSNAIALAKSAIQSTNGLCPTAALAGYIPTGDARYLAALTNAAQFATAAQGAKADTALQSITGAQIAAAGGLTDATAFVSSTALVTAACAPFVVTNSTATNYILMLTSGTVCVTRVAMSSNVNLALSGLTTYTAWNTMFYRSGALWNTYPTWTNGGAAIFEQTSLLWGLSTNSVFGAQPQVYNLTTVGLPPAGAWTVGSWAGVELGTPAISYSGLTNFYFCGTWASLTNTMAGYWTASDKVAAEKIAARTPKPKAEK